MLALVRPRKTGPQEKGTLSQAGLFQLRPSSKRDDSCGSPQATLPASRRIRLHPREGI